VRRIAREQAEAGLFRLSEKRISIEDQVHGARSRCKKLRGLLRLVRGSLDEIYERENGILRDAARSLAPARDAAVVPQTFENLIQDQRFGRTCTNAVRRILKASREAANGSADSRALLAKSAETFRAILPRIETWQLDDREFRAIRHGLDRCYRRSRMAMQAAEKGDAADWHEWRRRAKDHWFHMRLLRNVWRPEMDARAAALKGLTDLLGEDHDLAVLRSVVEEAQTLSAAAHDSLVALIEERQSALRAEARGEGQRLFAEKPAAFARRVRSYWKVWRRAAAG
jgi:CHAD domain-containing protein